MPHRVGIIPFDIRDDSVAILFITSQTRGRWVLPKGKVEAGESHVETCHREGFEEAGVTGVVLENFPITVVVTKQEEDGLGENPVTYYPFLVLKQADEWPEMKERQRHWTLIDQAARVAYREDLLPLVELFDDLLPWVKEASREYIDQS